MAACQVIFSNSLNADCFYICLTPKQLTMKSFIAYPLEFEKLLYPSKTDRTSSGRLAAHYELFKRIKHIDGAIIKCGINAEEGFTRFAMFRGILGHPITQKMVAFEKFQPVFEEEMSETGNITLKVNASRASVTIDNVQKTLKNIGINNNIEFVPGSACQTIPDFLIQNPELKIALLNIDLDDYEATMTTLEFLYPRLVQGGILILDNYYKGKADRCAVDDYFAPGKVLINNFSVNKGPHYIMKD